MSVRYTVTLGEVGIDLLDEIVDWLEDLQIHYHPYIFIGPQPDQAYISVDFECPKDAMFFKLAWADCV